MMSEEDRIKFPIYERFREEYFNNRKDSKTKIIQLNPEEKREFFHLQRRYVEEEYQKIKYNLKAA